MSGKMVSTTVYMTARQQYLLRLLAAETRVPFSEFVRRGIDMAIEAERERIENGTAIVLDEAQS